MYKIRPCLVKLGDFVRLGGDIDIYGYVSGIDEEPHLNKYYVEVDIGVDKTPLYLYDDQLEVLDIVKE